MTLRINNTQHNSVLPICWGLRFSYCYAEWHYAECRYTECRCAECRNAECHGTIKIDKHSKLYQGPNAPENFELNYAHDVRKLDRFKEEQKKF